MNGYADLGTLWLNIGVKNKVNDEFKGVEKTVTEASKKVADLGKNFTKYVTLPLAGLGALAVKEFADFESAMSKVQATTGATGDELILLKDKARNTAKSSIYSAEEVAQAMNYMAMAGWDTTQIMSGLDGVLTLAVASGEELATVSDIVTDALTAFGLSAEDTQDFVDLLANTARSANTNVSMLGESFKYVAPVSASLGISAEQTALALGLLANNGIKGSQAGTSLRSAINQLIKPSTEAANIMKEYGIAIQTTEDGSVDLMKTFDSLKNGISDLDKTQQAQIVSTLVGTEAMSGVMAIINATESDITKLTEATTDYSGSAKEMADTMNNNVKGNINKLKSSFSELLIVVGENIVPIFTKLVEKATEIVDWFGSLDEGTQEFIVNMGMVSVAIGPVLSVMGKLSSAFTPVNAALSATGTTAGTVIPALTGSGGLVTAFSSFATVLTGPVGIALVATAGGFFALNQHAKDTAVLSFDDTLKNIEGLSSETATMVSNIVSEWDTLKDQTQKMMDDQATITEEGLSNVTSSYTSHFDNLITLEQQNGEERLAWLQQKYEESEGEQKNYYYRLLTEEQIALDNSVSIHEENKEEVLQIMSDLSEGKITDVQAAMDRINEIITESTEEEIKNSVDKGEELLVLSRNFAALEESLRAEQASKIIKEANAVKDEKITATNEAYDTEVRNILGLTTITNQERKKMLEDAEKRKNEEIKIAHEQKMGILDELCSAYPELSNVVNYETGEINGAWSQMWKRISSSHETEMQKMVKNTGEEIGDVMGYYDEWVQKGNDGLLKLYEGHENASKQAELMGDKVRNASELSESSLKKPIDKVDTLHKKLSDLPSNKTVNVTVNETTNKRTVAYATQTSSPRMIPYTAEATTWGFEDALYNLTAFNTGFNPSDEIARYEANASKESVQTFSSKGIEDKLDKAVELLKKLGNLEVYLDGRTLIGELAPGMSKELAKGVRMR